MTEKRKKQIGAAVAILVFAVSLTAGWYVTLRKGVYVGDQFYYKVSDTRYRKNKENYIERVGDGQYRIVDDSGEKTVSLQVSGISVTLDFSDKTSYKGQWNGKELTDEDGFSMDWSWARNEAPTEEENTDPDYIQAICRIYFQKMESISQWYFQVLGAIVYIFGIITMHYPDRVYFFMDHWRFQDPRLSEAGRSMEQVNGGICVLFGIALMSGVIFLLIG